MRGHIVKRSASSYTIVINLGRDPETGKWKQQWVSVKGTKREAEKRLAELHHQLDTGSLIKPSKLTLGEFLRQWLRDYASTNVRAATLEGYRITIERHLIPSLGAIPLSQLKPPHLQSYYARALKEGRRDGTGGLSARSVVHHHRVLRQALSHAMKWGLVIRNVADAVDPPRPMSKEMKALDSAGVSRLLDEARGTMYFPLIHLATFTGMRRSELLGLRWKDVDLRRATVSISQVLHCLPGHRIVFEPPKTAKSRRLVTLSQEAVLALRTYGEMVEADLAQLGSLLTGDRLVFSQLDGSPFLPNTVTHAFAKIARRAGLEGIHFHSLRHSHASIMLQEGVSSKVVAERLGHSTVALTLDVYSHVTPGLKEDAAGRFEEALRHAEAPTSGKSH